MLPKEGKVIRGVMVRGKAHREGTILPIVEHPKTQDEISPQEYMDLKNGHSVIGVYPEQQAAVAAASAQASDLSQAVGKK